MRAAAAEIFSRGLVRFPDNYPRGQWIKLKWQSNWELCLCEACLEIGEIAFKMNLRSAPILSLTGLQHRLEPEENHFVSGLRFFLQSGQRTLPRNSVSNAFALGSLGSS
jgi:hypothetical protein